MLRAKWEVGREKKLRKEVKEGEVGDGESRDQPGRALSTHVRSRARAHVYTGPRASSIARINLTWASVEATAHGRQIRFQGPGERWDRRVWRGSTEPTAIPVSKGHPDYQ